MKATIFKAIFVLAISLPCGCRKMSNQRPDNADNFQSLTQFSGAKFSRFIAIYGDPDELLPASYYDVKFGIESEKAEVVATYKNLGDRGKRVYLNGKATIIRIVDAK